MAGLGVGTYTLFIGDELVVGELVINANGFVGGLEASLSIGSSHRDLFLTVVPEPGTAVLASGGLAYLLVAAGAN